MLLEMCVNNQTAVIEAFDQNNQTFHGGYRGFSCPIYAIYFLDIKIYIILQVTVVLKDILNVKLTTVHEDCVK